MIINYFNLLIKNLMDKLDKNISIYSFEGMTDRKGQDYYSNYEFDIEGINIKVIGLYNGHGAKGKECSKYVSDAIDKFILDNKNELKNLASQDNKRELITKLFVEGFKKIQKEIEENDENHASFALSGSTATITLIINKNICFIINLGHNCAIIGRKVNGKNDSIEVYTNHEISKNKEEQERIKKIGGEVRINNNTRMRIYKKDDSCNPGLCVSRTLGDTYSRDVISDEPEINVYNLEKKDDFIILGTDAIWEYMTSQEIVDFIYKRINEKSEQKKNIAEEVVNECKKNWSKINKSKDIKFFEEIKNNPKLDNNKKNEEVKGFVEILENNACLNPDHKKLTSIPSIDELNPDEIFHGNHHIYDITCIIYFFEKN